MNVIDQNNPITEGIAESITNELQIPDVKTNPKSTWDIENPPYWSHVRSEQRAQRRRERQMKKILHNYQ